MTTERSAATPGEVMRAAIDELVRLRPAALSHFNHSGKGRYSHLIHAWRAMVVRCLSRQTDELLQSRLGLASGRGLRELVASEFFLDNVNEDATTSLGHVELSRLGKKGTTPGTLIRAGGRFIRSAQPNATPVPITTAEYEVSESVVVPVDRIANIIVPIRATANGPRPNIVQDARNSIILSIADEASFSADPDNNVWTIVANECAGGRAALIDDDLTRMATFQPLGQQGPNDAAAIAGVLRSEGVRYIATFRDGDVGRLIFFLADQSWGSGSRWKAQVRQSLKNEWLGFGCRIEIGGVINQLITIAAQVQLRDAKYLEDPSEITDAIAKATRNYFDNRPDWYQWKLSALRGVLSRCDRRILQCSSVVVTDQDGSVVPEPVFISVFGLFDPGDIIHYYLKEGGVSATYAPPV